MSRILTIDNLCVSYGSTPVLRGVSLSVDSGEILGVVGESGSGKSTTIYAALGILGSGGKIENGTICYKQSNLMEQKKEALRGLRGKETVSYTHLDVYKRQRLLRMLGIKTTPFWKSIVLNNAVRQFKNHSDFFAEGCRPII